MERDAPAHEIIVVPAVGQPGREELRQQCYDLRVEVFHHEQGFSVEDEFDKRVPIFFIHTEALLTKSCIGTTKPPHTSSCG